MRLNSVFSRLSRLSIGAGAAVTLLTFAGAAFAGDFTFSGSFVKDDDVSFFRFDVTDAASPVTLTTDSYAAGGFDPILSLFRGSDNSLIADNDDISFPDNKDSRIEITLDPGTYLVALTQSDNFAFGPKLGEGFIRQGEGNFTGGPFLDPNAGQRTGSFGVSIQNVTGAGIAAPEPASAGLAVLGIGCWVLGGVIRRRAAN